MENIVLADCSADEVKSLASELVFNNKKFTIKSHIANWKRNGALTELKRYAKYFFVAFKYFFTRKKYDMIIGWQQFYALIFCFYCSLFSVKKKNTVVVLNFTYKEKAGRFSKLYKWFMQKCISEVYLDYIHVLSADYAEKVSQEFGFPKEKIIVTHFGVNDLENNDFSVPDGFEKESYALAIGRSNRDYDFLCRAWSGINYPLVIISDTYKKDVSKLKNITVLNNVYGEESYKWIAHCGLMIIPIDDGSICSGDTVLLRAMSLKCKIIVTKPSTLAEMYISDGKNALLSRKDEDELRGRIESVLYSTEFSELGENARQSFLEKYSLSSMGRKINSSINV